ncbi:UDP-3-O-(3-hydroxymyristoyl)glucosamine N-acyltransferase [Eudoraea sp.]|uniref:UDP-3-O-(3-hydroxymyristoyl)glucosamine N-acyltransferase n=1 Tax=Eudoraea sp. TaxID=1979955 RepID=UPI003C73DAFA
MISFTAQDLNKSVDGKLIGDISEEIIGLETVDRAEKGEATFIGSVKYAKKWGDSKASLVFFSKGIPMEPHKGAALIEVANADLAMAKLLDLFSPESPNFETDIAPTAVIHNSAKIGENSKIGAGSYIGKDVIIGNNVVIYPNVTIFDQCEIGDNTIIWSGTVIRERSIIGSHCIFHNNVSIGADGFGYRPSEDGQGLVKIPHIGNVVIGDHVEIGANSCVDRAKFSSTILGYGCKIDNLVQIGHNCILGRFCIMAGSSGLAGSVTLGDGVVIGGSASINDNTYIGAGATVGAGSGVVGDVAAGKTVLGYPACDSRDMLKQWIALRNLAKN